MNRTVDYRKLDRRPDDEPSAVDCVIRLELAIVPPSSPGRHEQPTFVELPVRIRDVNDHSPKFDQHTSGLWLEVDEDNQNPSSTEHQLAGRRGEAISADQTVAQRRREVAVLPLAKDADYGVNGTVTYSLGVSAC
ncbi:hypothetical protein FBUS_03958 [Fasciolopsis buskii]|uniref:Cadherin domain-containing protein n=1 Tax=Fasciolopsis buskii TaxID=27845 RepID=A0A8E0RYL7_9TREM|nr:hypothetical protein FBUS_03958 [Fasciolopsis buski]